LGLCAFYDIIVSRRRDTLKYSSNYFNIIAISIWVLTGLFVISLLYGTNSHFMVYVYILTGGFILGSVFAFFATSVEYYEKILRNTPRISKGVTHIDKKDFSKK
jgi:hypothetical protein